MIAFVVAFALTFLGMVGAIIGGEIVDAIERKKGNRE